jgi:cytochrome c oxidase subunit IV
MDEKKKKEAFQVGLSVFILLVLMTIGEFLIGAFVVGWGTVLILIAVLKAALIIRDYMHLPRLFSGDEEGH